MTEIGLAEYFSMGEAIGIIGTLFVILHFSRKQTQSLSVDIETKVLNDLAQRMHALHEILIERPQLIKVVSKIDANSPEIAYSYDILFTFSHVFHMRQRKVLNDNEWIGWLRWVKSAFQQGAIMEIWQSTIEMEKWFDPAFQEFVNRELVPRVPENKKIDSMHR
ncbi:MAG TPA: hypothetical protein VF884_12410 [Nitrososphaeraceae archaeon]